MREYIGDYLNHTLFVCFGNNDTRMLIESMRISHPKNQPLAKTWLPHFFDLMTFMSQFIRDDKNNTFSLINFLKLYNIEPTGVSHNPLNDAKDLKNLYIKFLNDKETLLIEYRKLLLKMKLIPEPVKKLLFDIMDDKEINKDIFNQYLKDYLE
mgnify:FL=1